MAGRRESRRPHAHQGFRAESSAGRQRAVPYRRTRSRRRVARSNLFPGCAGRGALESGIRVARRVDTARPGPAWPAACADSPGRDQAAHGRLSSAGASRGGAGAAPYAPRRPYAPRPMRRGDPPARGDSVARRGVLPARRGRRSDARRGDPPGAPAGGSGEGGRSPRSGREAWPHAPPRPGAARRCDAASPLPASSLQRRRPAPGQRPAGSKTRCRRRQRPWAAQGRQGLACLRGPRPGPVTGQPRWTIVCGCERAG